MLTTPISSPVPSILIASIAMQESTCNPDTEGGGGEQGLMQLTPDKCGGAPGGNCKDPVSLPIPVPRPLSIPPRSTCGLLRLQGL